jgi:hypothetical protein
MSVKFTYEEVGEVLENFPFHSSNFQPITVLGVDLYQPYHYLLYFALYIFWVLIPLSSLAALNQSTKYIS